MNDQQIVEYLRSRAAVTPPLDFSQSVMEAVESAPAERFRFSALLPAVVALGAAAVIAALALLLGPGRDVGPAPSASAEPSATASDEPTIDDLRFALLEAVDVLQAAPGVEGRQQAEISGTIGSVTWFDWRPNGDQVVVQRTDLDVTETGWWMVPDGAPPATGQRIYTFIGVNLGDESFFTDEAGDWQVAPRDGGYYTGALGLGILDGAILPWQLVELVVRELPDPSDARIEREDLPDGGVGWQLAYQWLGDPLTQRWTIGPGGELRAWTFEREDPTFDPDGDFSANATHAWLEFTVSDDSPIEPPDVEAVPDASAVGVPPDLPLEPPPAGTSPVQQVATCEHPSGRYRVTLPHGWWTNVSSEDASGPWEACELFGPQQFAVTPSGDQTWPHGVALTIGWIDGGCIGSIWELLSSEETTVDDLPATVNEYAVGVDPADTGGAYEYVVDLSEPGVACEIGGRFIMAATNREMSGDYETNKDRLDQIMAGIEIAPP